MTVGLVVIVLATYVIIRTIGGDSSSSIEVDLDAPAVVVDGQQGVPVDMNVMPPAPNQVQVAPQPAVISAVSDEKNIVEKERKIDKVREEQAWDIASFDFFNINFILSYLVRAALSSTHQNSTSKFL